MTAVFCSRMTQTSGSSIPSESSARTVKNGFLSGQEITWQPYRSGRSTGQRALRLFQAPPIPRLFRRLCLPGKCFRNDQREINSHTCYSNRPTIDSVPPPSKHLMALVSSSALPKSSSSSLARVQSSVPVPAVPSVAAASFKDLTPGNFLPAQESRRRNAEQREAALRSDPLISEVEPNRVFCSICRKWVQLRQDSTYCAYPWVQHRGKCLNRQYVFHLSSPTSFH